MLSTPYIVAQDRSHGPLLVLGSLSHLVVVERWLALLSRSVGCLVISERRSTLLALGTYLVERVLQVLGIVTL